MAKRKEVKEYNNILRVMYIFTGVVVFCFVCGLTYQIVTKFETKESSLLQINTEDPYLQTYYKVFPMEKLYDQAMIERQSYESVQCWVDEGTRIYSEDNRALPPVQLEHLIGEDCLKAYVTYRNNKFTDWAQIAFGKVDFSINPETPHLSDYYEKNSQEHEQDQEMTTHTRYSEYCWVSEDYREYTESESQTNGLNMLYGGHCINAWSERRNVLFKDWLIANDLMEYQITVIN